MRHRWLSTVRRTAAATVAAGLVLGQPAVPAAGAGSGRAAPPAGGQPAGQSPQWQVTLITGDQVTVGQSGGVAQLASARSGPGRAVQFIQRSDGTHLYVFPSDALAAVAAGRLDERLFDVAGLVDAGYDDAHRGDLPLLLRAPAGAEKKQTVPEHAQVGRRLPGLGLTSVRVDKEESADFWRAARAGAATGAALASGLDTIWLDAPVHATLDQSVPQIGAPEAWQAGYTGAGVPVAVLDTGYDPTHPDLSGVVAGSANFTGESTVVDGSGHGTHVASTIAGSGAASGGRYTGVAPGARLLVGKVLDSFGGGTESQVIAGMQWAVDQGARVVSMSLGGKPTDGTDPLSLALNELSDSSGALFVVAAGNSGADRTVASPASADAALAVASVTKSDQLSSFSSRGPRVGDFGLKPELAAPGSDIVAARAAGTLDAQAVDDHYAKLSGTSMATPHAAGAAAIVAGQHPDWTAEQLKAELMGTAQPIDGTDVFGQGAGRVDVARAVRQAVHAGTAELSLGTLAWPHSGAPGTHQLVYRNDSDAPVTLALDLSVASRGGAAAPAGLVTLDSSSVTVPAGGSAQVGVTVTATDERIGQYLGRITASSGELRLTTPLAVEVAGPTHELTVTAVDRSGQPVPAFVSAQNLDTGYAVDGVAEDGVLHLTVPEGRYRLSGELIRYSPLWAHFEEVTIFARDGVSVLADHTESIDARTGEPVLDTVDNPTARREQLGFGTQSVVAGRDGTSRRLNAVTTDTRAEFDLYSIGATGLPGLDTLYLAEWAQPWVTATRLGDDPYELAMLFDNSGLIGDGGRVDNNFRGTLEAELADAGDGSPGQIGDVRGKIALLSYSPGGTVDPLQAVRDLKAAGAVFVLAQPYVSDLSILPVFQYWDLDGAERLRADLASGPVRLRLDSRRDSPYAYHLYRRLTGQVPAGWTLDFAAAQLGRRDATFHSVVTGELRAGLDTRLETADLVGNLFTDRRLPQASTEYFSPGLTWRQAGSSGIDISDLADFGMEVDLPFQLAAGQHTTTSWFAAPHGPELIGAGEPAAYRQGDTLTAQIPVFGDADPAHYAAPQPETTGSTVLYRDGERIASSTAVGQLTTGVGAGVHDFRLVVEGDCTSDAWPLATRVASTWSWRGGSTPADGPTALPLLDVRWGLPLDGNNAAPAGSRLTGTVGVVYPEGAATAAARVTGVEVSYDDGQTWAAAKLSGSGAGRQVTLPAGGTAGGFATLRVRASDSAGGALTETITRAYRLG